LPQLLLFGDMSTLPSRGTHPYQKRGSGDRIMASLPLYVNGETANI